MGIFNKIFSSSNEDDYNAKLSSLVIYNTYDNLIILLQFGNNNFASIINFVNICNRIGLNIEFSEYINIEREDDSKEFKANTPPKIRYHRLYILISGCVEKYAKLFDYISLNDDVLKLLLLDIYNNCDSTYFSKLIENNVLTLSRFKYRNVKPKYDDHISINNPMKKHPIEIDDISKILKQLPESFIGIDILRSINIYDDNRILTSYDLIENITNKTHESVDDNNYDIMLFKCLCKDLYSILLNDDDLTIDKLYMITSPVYFKDTIYDSNIDFNTGQLSFDELDHEFQQQYDRFTLNGSEGMTYYTSIDEKTDV